MKFVASELREYMSKLGVKTVDELVGRIDLIKRKEGITGQAAEVDLSNILDTNFVSEKVEYNKKSLYDFKLESTLDERILCKEFAKVLAKGTKKKVEVNVRTLTVHSVQSSVPRLQESITTTLMTIHLQ